MDHPVERGGEESEERKAATQRKSSQLIYLARAGVPNERRLRDLCKFS